MIHHAILSSVKPITENCKTCKPSWKKCRIHPQSSRRTVETTGNDTVYYWKSSRTISVLQGWIADIGHHERISDCLLCIELAQAVFVRTDPTVLHLNWQGIFWSKWSLGGFWKRMKLSCINKSKMSARIPCSELRFHGNFRAKTILGCTSTLVYFTLVPGKGTPLHLHRRRSPYNIGVHAELKIEAFKGRRCQE